MTHASPVEYRPSPRANRSFNSKWTITLFGTAVGAGILFLPISAGSFGFWPLVVATALIGPMTFLGHRAFGRIVSRSPRAGADVLEVLTDFFGRRAGVCFALIYWFTVFPVVLIYGVSITNAVDSFIVNQLGGPHVNTWVLATVCVGAMTAALAFGTKFMLIVAQVVVYPLIIALGAVSLYLIPQWDLGSFLQTPTDNLLGSIVLILPVLVFAFSYVAAVSQFCVDAQRQYGPRADQESSRVILATSVLLTAFTMFFVWSCALALGADGMAEAKAQNLPVLSYFANVTGTQFMAYMAPVVVICAIVSSFIGHALGTVEGTQYLFRLAAPRLAGKVSRRGLDLGTYGFIFLATTAAAVANPSILDLITLVGGVFFAFMTYLLPMVVIYRVEAFAPLRRRASNYFLIAVGCVVIGATIWGMV